MTGTNQLQIKATPVFYANLKAYQKGYPVIVNEGGSRSSKSYSLVQLLICIADGEAGKRISIVSHSLPHIKRGTYRDFKTIMEEWGMWNEESFSYTDFVYTFPNGSYIELFGLEDEGKARGPSRDILFVNEANLIKKTLFDQLAMRTTGQIFIDYNPADFVNWVYSVADDPKNKCIKSTYKNNLANLSPSQIAMIEGYRDLADDFMWKVYGLGERGAAKEIIYTAWKQVDEMPRKGDVFYGLDFGYTNPTALVQVEYYEGAVYAKEVLYQRGLTLSDLVPLLRDELPANAVVYADAAEPRSIEELYRAGVNVLPADKDVWAGILAVKSRQLNIHRDSHNLKAELMSYKWKKDKNDNILEEPVKDNDHLCDALRYAIFTHLGRPQLTWGII